MKLRGLVGILGLSVSLAALVPSVARAQQIELGTSLINATVALGDETVTVVGVPMAGLGLLNPGLYASFFAGKHVAIEPQVGFMWANSDGESMHLLNVAAQFDYFLFDTSRRSPYVFASAGLVNITDAGYTPKSFGAGVGCRFPVGDRLVFRLDGRYVHYTSEFDDGSDTLAFTVSIGGVFGR